MTPSSPSRWSGLDLAPLPHESSLSILFRFGWRNALNFSQIAQIVKDNPGQTTNLMLENRWIDARKFHEETKWDVPQPTQANIPNFLEGLVAIWFDLRVRHCPICLEHGYHSIWHQFRPLPLCPIHHCKLTSQCQNCGKALPDLRFSKELFDVPFICHVCRCPFSGAAPDLQLHLDFREHRQTLETIFAPFCDWLNEAKTKLALLRALENQNPAREVSWNQWCRPRELLLSIGNQLHPLPMECALQKDDAIILCISDIPVSELENTDIQNTRSQWGRRTAIPNQIYRDTLKKLRHWLLLNISHTHLLQAENASAISSTSQIDLWNRDPRELAYVLLRAKIEHGDSDGLRSSTDFAQVADAPLIKIPSYHGLIPEAGLRWVYYAMFSVLVAIIGRARRRRNIMLHELDMRDSTLLLQGWVRHETHLTVLTVFPRVEGSPIDVVE